MFNNSSATYSSNVSGEYNSQGPATRFCCTQCPFIGCNKVSLRKHMKHHTYRFSFQCSFCTFSVSSKHAVMRHINRVHPEQNNKAVKKRVMMPKIRGPSIVNTVIHPASADLPVPITMPAALSPQVEAEDPPHEIREVDVFEDQLLDYEDEEEEIMVMENKPDQPCCLSCSKEQGSNQYRMVQCDECKSWFHASCVNLTDVIQLDSDKQWFCPLCINKETPLRHMTKLVQALDSFNYQVYHGEKGPLEDIEEMNYRKELNQFAEDIGACRANLVQASEEMEAEARQLLSSKDSKLEDLRQRMEALRIPEQGLSKELAAFMEQKKGIQKKASEKTDLKVKTERELFLINFSSGSQEVWDSSLDKNKKATQKKEKLVGKLKKRLEEIGVQERDLNERILITEGKLGDVNKKLVDLIKDLELLRALPVAPPSPIVVRVNALKGELRERINHFAFLEENLVELTMKRIIDDIRQKKNEWLESYVCHDDAEA